MRKKLNNMIIYYRCVYDLNKRHPMKIDVTDMQYHKVIDTHIIHVCLFFSFVWKPNRALILQINKVAVE
jgi:hypothetical protein